MTCCNGFLQAVSVADKDVFGFHMVNYVDATDGDAYTDMDIVDTSVTLTVGCIQVIFVNKFVSSILVSVLTFGEPNCQVWMILYNMGSRIFA